MSTRDLTRGPREGTTPDAAPRRDRAARGGVAAGVAAFFALDDDWERPGTLTRRDWVVGATTLVLSLALLELVRGAGGLDEADRPAWAQRLVVVVGAALLVPRRRWPLTVAVLAAAHLFVTGVLMPVVMGQLALQVIYFVALFSGVAWARSRRDMLLVMTGVVVFMFAWLGWQLALGNALDSMLGEEDLSGSGPIGPVTAAVALSFLVNLLYFGGAVLGGQVAWRAARQRQRLAEQTTTIREQSDALRDRAVVQERLRIARELHDVVAHHVSVIGIQAAAARRVLDRDRVAALEALGGVESSSREAVTQMRSLVGTLRGSVSGDEGDASTGSAGNTSTPRSPDPTWRDLPSLVAEASGPGLTATQDLVESPAGAADTLPQVVGLSAYRIVQEALTNVRRHSTADRVAVVLRVDRASTPPFAEVEVTDDGRPKAGNAGSGLGLLGVRERAAARGGEVEIGPRAVGGFRVRVRFPLGDA